MKKFFAIASLLALTLSACSDDVAQSEQKGEGRVTIGCVAATNVVETRANVGCTTPTAEDFALKIEGVGHTYTADYATIAEFNEGDNYLHLGSYKATVVAGDIAEEGYDKATFVGSANFSVEARKNTEVEITATIANTLVKVEVTDGFKTYFAGGHALKLTTAAGNEFDVTEQTEQAEPIFIAPASFTISGTAVKQPNQSGKEGATITLPEYKMEKPAAQTFYTVKFDVKDAGSATLEITLNEKLEESIDIEQELNDNAATSEGSESEDNE
jgi:opacity protein-like surface antigen